MADGICERCASCGFPIKKDPTEKVRHEHFEFSHTYHSICRACVLRYQLEIRILKRRPKSELEQENISLKKTLDVNEKAWGETGVENRELKEENTILIDENRSLKERIASIDTSTVDEYKQEITRLTAEIGLIKKQHSEVITPVKMMMRVMEEDMIRLKEEKRRRDEEYIRIDEENATLKQTVSALGAELQRKRPHDDTVNSSEDPTSMNGDESFETKKCNVCAKEKTSQSFQRTSKKKNKEGVTIVYTSSDDTCHTCSTKLYRLKKKAKIS